MADAPCMGTLRCPGICPWKAHNSASEAQVRTDACKLGLSDLPQNDVNTEDSWGMPSAR